VNGGNLNQGGIYPSQPTQSRKQYKAVMDVDGRLAMRRLKKERSKKRMSQEDLAKVSGISSVTIGKLENDPTYWDYRVNKKTVDKLATALGVTPEYLEGTARGDDDDDLFETEQSTQETVLSANAPQVALAPGRAQVRVPRLAHLLEPWYDRKDCFKEAAGMAFDEWANSDDFSPENLSRLLDQHKQEWGKLHGVPFVAGPQAGRPSELPSETPIYSVFEDGTVDDSRPDGTLSDVAKPGQPIASVRTGAKGKQPGVFYDEFHVGDRWFAVQRQHDDNMKDPHYAIAVESAPRKEPTRAPAPASVDEPKFSWWEKLI